MSSPESRSQESSPKMARKKLPSILAYFPRASTRQEIEAFIRQFAIPAQIMVSANSKGVQAYINFNTIDEAAAAFAKLKDQTMRFPKGPVIFREPKTPDQKNPKLKQTIPTGNANIAAFAIKIHNVPPTLTEEDFKRFFVGFESDISSIKLLKPKPGYTNRMVFVNFRTEAAANFAFRKVQQHPNARAYGLVFFEPKAAVVEFEDTPQTTGQTSTPSPVTMPWQQYYGNQDNQGALTTAQQTISQDTKCPQDTHLVCKRPPPGFDGIHSIQSTQGVSRSTSKDDSGVVNMDDSFWQITDTQIMNWMKDLGIDDHESGKQYEAAGQRSLSSPRTPLQWSTFSFLP